MVEYVHHYSICFNIFSFYTQSSIGRQYYGTIIGVKPGVEYISKISDKQRYHFQLERIAYCESGNQQFNKDGTLKRGQLNKHDIGKWQINEIYWGSEAKRLGYNIETLEGNSNMALHIIRKYGTHPWDWSKECWSR